MGHSLTARQQFDTIIESVQQEALAAAAVRFRLKQSPLNDNWHQRT
jgi:hypothetical protein